MSTLAEQIETWLSESGDYHTGLELLKKSGFSGFMLTILNRGDDAYTRPKLAAELTGWLNSRTEPATAPALEPAADSKAIQLTRVPPKAIRELQLWAGTLMDERAELKAKIRALADEPTRQEVRRDAAGRILQIGKQLDEIYGRIRFFEQYGYMPPDDPVPPDQDDRARLMTVRTYVSRYKTKLKKPGLTPEQRQETEKLLADYEEEKRLLDTRLQ